MSKGDWVRVYVRSGLDLKQFEIMARQNGRKVEVENGSKEVKVTEITRGGTTVSSMTFSKSEVIAIEEERKDGE